LLRRENPAICKPAENDVDQQTYKNSQAGNLIPQKCLVRGSHSGM
jgi:hypothetical protein